MALFFVVNTRNTRNNTEKYIFLFVDYQIINVKVRVIPRIPCIPCANTTPRSGKGLLP